MSKLLSQGGFGCVFYPGIKCDGQPNPSKKIVTKIQENNFNAKNESRIGKLVESLPNYKVYFLPVINSCPINIRKINKSVISKCEIIKEKADYIAMDIDYITTVDFVSVLHKVSSKRLLLLLYQTYNYLLDALQELEKVSVVHYDLKLDNMLFVKETSQPRIIDFGISIPINEVTDDNLKKYFYVFAPEYYVWCPEINFINYLLHEDKDTLMESDIEMVIDMCIHNNPLLMSSVQSIQTEYKVEAKKYYKQFIGKKKLDIIRKLRETHKTWDNYSLSILLSSLINKLFDGNENKNGYIFSLERLFLRNIHPDPSVRLNLIDTSSKLDEVLYEDGNVKSYLTLTRHINKNVASISNEIQRELSHLNKSKRRDSP